MGGEIVGFALGGLAVGAAIALWLDIVAPRWTSMVLVISIIAALFQPMIWGLSSAQPFVQAAHASLDEKSVIDGFRSACFFFPIPLGSACVALFRTAGPRILSLTLCACLGLPAYLMFAFGSMLAGGVSGVVASL